MRFHYVPVETLPKLAWCAVLSKGEETIIVYHGPWVETHEQFFVDGGWDGDFMGGRLHQASFLAGTGAALQDGGVVFCCPTHVLERLYYLHQGDRLYISPSMTFLLSLTGTQLDIHHIPYHMDLFQMIRGMKYHIGSLKTRTGRFEVVHFRNLVIDKDLNVTPITKPDFPDFTDFASYKAYLVTGLKRLADNFRSPSRRVRYEPIATISSGYDSSAYAALSTTIGCREAVTFQRNTSGTKADSGAKTAEKLGLRAIEFDRDAMLELGGFPEAEFVAVGNSGEDSVMSVMEESFRQRFVIVGVHGDHVWERVDPNVSRDISRGSCNCCDLGEFRWRVGFSIVPLAFWGCTSHPSIWRISQSEEMKPWSVGGTYDRPIPRRIVEEMGVDRQLFGQSKKAVTIYFSGRKGMLRKMNPNSAQSFEKFYQENKRRRSWIKRFWYTLLYYLYVLQYVTIGVKKIPCPIPLRYRRCPGRPSFLVHWGQALIRDRYKIPADRMAPSK